MAKLIKRIGFEHMNERQISAVFEFMDFIKELAEKTGDKRAIDHAAMQCRRLTALFQNTQENFTASNVIPFKGRI